MSLHFGLLTNQLLLLKYCALNKFYSQALRTLKLFKNWKEIENLKNGIATKLLMAGQYL